jgi:selenocysteine lyase/cysteine desulfurase
MAELLQTDADGIALIPSVSYAMAVAALNLPVRSGQTIVVLDEEFPSNYHAWNKHAAANGAVLRVVRRSFDEPWLPAILEAVDSRTAIVAVPVCHWTDGALIGIEEVAARARSVGAALVIDASQSLGIIPIDVTALDPDFVVAVGYKWLLGPFGMSYLYVAPRHRVGTPLEQAWPARRGSEDLSRLVEYQDDYRNGARRFDAGEQQNFILLPMAIAALEQMRSWQGPDTAWWLATLTEEIVRVGVAAGLGATPAEVRSPHMTGLRCLDNSRASQITNALREDNVYVSARGALVRIAPHMHTTSTDLARLSDALKRVT